MNCHGRAFGSLILVLLVSACGSSHTGWKSLPVAIYADSSITQSSQTYSDLKDAFQFWDDKAGRQVFDFKGTWNSGTPFTGNPTKPDSILGNVVFFQNPWPYPQNYVGMTTVQNGSDGPQAAMVMINGNSQFCTGDCLYDNRVSSRKTFAHELGHFIGLQHNADPNDLMYPDAQPGGTLNAVKIDSAALSLLVTGQ